MKMKRKDKEIWIEWSEEIEAILGRENGENYDGTYAILDSH